MNTALFVEGGCKVNKLVINACFVFVCLVTLTGCGGPKNEIVSATGKIVFEDGTTLPMGTRLLLSPVQGGVGTASATIEADGSFTLVHQTGRSGAEVGVYSVELRAPEGATASFWETIPEQYASGSFTTLNIAKGDGAHDIKLKR